MVHIKTALTNDAHYIMSAAVITYIIYKLLFMQPPTDNYGRSPDDWILKTPANPPFVPNSILRGPAFGKPRREDLVLSYPAFPEPKTPITIPDNDLRRFLPPVVRVNKVAQIVRAIGSALKGLLRGISKGAAKVVTGTARTLHKLISTLLKQWLGQLIVKGVKYGLGALGRHLSRSLRVGTRLIFSSISAGIGGGIRASRQLIIENMNAIIPLIVGVINAGINGGARRIFDRVRITLNRLSCDLRAHLHGLYLRVLHSLRVWAITLVKRTIERARVLVVRLYRHVGRWGTSRVRWGYRTLNIGTVWLMRHAWNFAVPRVLAIRRFVRRIIIRAARRDYIVIIRILQGAWRLALDVYGRFHLTQAWVHTFWIYLCRFRRTNFNWRASVTLLRRLYVWLPRASLIFLLTTGLYSLGINLLITSIHQLLAWQTIDVVSLANLVQLYHSLL